MANSGKELMKSTLRWRTPWNSTTTSRSCTTQRDPGVKNKRTLLQGVGVKSEHGLVRLDEKDDFHLVINILDAFPVHR